MFSKFHYLVHELRLNELLNARTDESPMIKSVLLPEAEVCLQAKSFNRSSFKSLQQQKAHLSYQVNVTVVCIRVDKVDCVRLVTFD